MQQESIACPIKGCVIELEEVGDEAFSGGMLGEGFAVKPEEGKLYAPVDGIIAAVSNRTLDTYKQTEYN